jgi:pyrimidine-nucleoside phosphorylase
MPLIASSIMSKKIAAGAHAIVLDVKTGKGAFMETLEQARQLAELMVSIGELSGRKVAAVLSDMNQPLGVAVGNALEMKEAIQTLKGEGPTDFVEHCIEISSQMLLLGNRAKSKTEANRMATQTIESGSGFEYLKKLVSAQGGNVSYIETPEKFPQAPLKSVIKAHTGGFIAEVQARIVGETAVVLGAGRKKKGDAIDPSVGIEVLVKVGAKVVTGDPLFIVHAHDEQTLEEARISLMKAVQIVAEEVQPLPLFYGLVD